MGKVDYIRSHTLSEPAVGEIIRSVSSELFVIRENVLAADGDWLDPAAAEVALAANPALGYKIHRNPGTSYLELAFVWDADSPTSAAGTEDELPTAGPTIAVFGKAPRGGDFRAPSLEKVNADFLGVAQPEWVRLVDPNPPTAALNEYDIELGIDPVTVYTSGSESLSFSAPRRVYLCGTQEILVLISDPATFAGGTSVAVNRAALVARFHT